MENHEIIPNIQRAVFCKCRETIIEFNKKTSSREFCGVTPIKSILLSDKLIAKPIPTAMVMEVTP